MSFVKAVRSFSRLREVIRLLLREGFDEAVDQLHLHVHLPFTATPVEKKPKASVPVRLRRVMEDSGGAFVKLGQMLSLRSDLIPQEYCDEFSKLQDAVKPFPFSDVKRIVEQEIGEPLSKRFASFESVPIASASVGQVHKAKLKNGHVVAVKVQRPDIAKVFRADIDLLYYLADQVERHYPALKQFQPHKIVEEFEKYTQRELDYLQEGKNIDVFYSHYKNSSTIVIPKVHWDHTTPRVLTMDFIDGKKISEVPGLTAKQRKAIATTVYRSFLDQVFVIRTFHADPHPGNIFVMKGGKIAFLDFGIVGRVSPDLAENLEEMTIGLVIGDPRMVADSFIDLGMVEPVDEQMFREDLFEAWAPYHGATLKEINMAHFFADSFALARKHEVTYPGNFVLLAKAMVTVQGFGKKLYPQSSFIEVCRPQVEKLKKERRQPAYLLGSMKRGAASFASNVRKFPQDLRSLIHIFKKGTRVNVDVHHEDLRNFTLELDRSSNRITYGVIIGGFAIAAGLIILAGIGPTLWSVPVLAWVSIVIIAVLSMTLAISIVREKGGKFS